MNVFLLAVEISTIECNGLTFAHHGKRKGVLSIVSYTIPRAYVEPHGLMVYFERHPTYTSV